MAVGSWLAAHSVEIVFFTLIGGAFAYLLRISRDGYFQGDDWLLIRQSGSVGGLLEPYNDHLSVTILAVYRALVEVFGFSYWPFQVVGLVALMGVPVAYFLTTRRTWGPPLAAILALSMLGFNNLEFYPAVLNHALVLIGAIGCAAALNRGRRADWVLALSLLFALCAAGGGVAVAVACLVHNLATRPAMRRWLAVVGPTFLWGCWWLIAGQRESQFRPAEASTLRETLGYARVIVSTPFEHLSLGIGVLAVALAGIFVAYGLWRLRQGLAAAATFLAWTTAMVVWAVGLAYARGARGIADFVAVQDGVFYRYQVLALGFGLLAVVPRHPITWPKWLPAGTGSRWLPIAALLVLTIGVTEARTIRNDVQTRADTIEVRGRVTRGTLLVLDLGPDVVPNRSTVPRAFFGLQAGVVRALIDRYGSPISTTFDTIDQQLVDLGIASARLTFRRDLECSPVTEPFTWLQTGIRPLYLWSDEPTWTVEVRRFGTNWISIAEARADQGVRLELPTFVTDAPWQVRADGSCRRAT